MGIFAAGVVSFMAFESYTLDINAHLEPVLSVNPHGDWELGTVYPETGRTTKLFVGLSNSAKADGNFIAVQYTLSCQPKPLSGSSGGFAVLSGVRVSTVRNLCPNITVTEQVTGAILSCITSSQPCDDAIRTLTAASQPDGYLVAIVFPDCIGAHQKEALVKEIDCNFDPATGKFAGVDLGAQISVQVLGIDQEEKCITKKDGTELPGCVKGPNLPDLQPTFVHSELVTDPFRCQIFFEITNKKAADAGPSTTRVSEFSLGSADVATQAIAGGATVGGSATLPGLCFDPDLIGEIIADVNGELDENDEGNNAADILILG